MADTYSGLAWECEWPVCSIACAARALDEDKRVASSLHEDTGEWPVGTRPATEKDAHSQSEVAADGGSLP